VWYELQYKIAYLYFPFHNGAMSTQQCQLLTFVYKHLLTLPISVIVLMGGDDNWSNGIHLNHIEAANNSADESWFNINAMNDFIYQVINTLDKFTISAVAGNAGAGGVILALASDQVFAREGVIFNPHYKNMGDLYGSEYWTYLLPKRVGKETATRLTEQCLPISAKKALQIGLINKILDKQHAIFYAQVKYLAQAYAEDAEGLSNLLIEKTKASFFDELIKPLDTYRKFELKRMYANFYSNDDYHQARQAFVYKNNADKHTPENIAIHRQS
jgi:putative two-component system hydrogenase maturation factor HypX/HoxX